MGAVLLAASFAAALLATVPAHATSASTDSLEGGSPQQAEAVGLIVEYAPGAPIRESLGVPTGADQVSATDVEMGRSLPGGLRTVPFDTVQDADVAEAAARQIEQDPAVVSAEPDWIITVDDVEPSMTSRAVQTSPPWGLDRIDQRSGRDGSYRYGTTGAGVDAYVVDTGIRSTHVEFAGRIREGASFIYDGRGTEDCQGHGTHVAGTLGGTTYGVAKDVTLIPVRVFGCTKESTTSVLVQGINWVRSDHTGQRPAVMNMSLGGPRSSFVDSAVNAAIADGIVVVAAAGNKGEDACLDSPGNVPAVITVNASSQSDQRASFSNFGSCTDIYAPGVNITSAWWTSNTASAVIGGTSMAAPHVAGVVARILERDPSATPSGVWNTVSALATPNAVDAGIPGDPRVLLYAEADDLAPGAPERVRVTPGLASLTVSWMKPAGSVPDYYEIAYTSDDVTWVDLPPTTQTTATIERLAVDTPYSVRVRSVADGPFGGRSGWVSSDFVTPLSEAAVRVVAPTGVSAKLNGKKLRSTWSAPPEGMPVRYVVAVSVNGKAFKRLGSTSATRLAVTLPRPEARVLVRVRAVDDFGNGPWSAPVRAQRVR